MDISVVVLAYNEEKNIGDCLESVLTQEGFSGGWEVLAVDGGSQDNTLKIVSGKQAQYGRLRLIINPKRKIASGRNLGIQESRYAFIAFTDADCVVPKDWLKKLSGAYESLIMADDRIAALGAGNIPPAGSGGFYQSLGVYLDSFLGCFYSAQGRNFLTLRKVESLSCSNALYDKKILSQIDGFDEKLGNIGEDSDLNIRLRKRGYSLYFIPDSPVTHKLRPNLSSWLKNMALYGRGRAVISFKHRSFLSQFFMLPLCFSAAMIMVAFAIINPVFLLPLLYFPAIALYVFIILLKKGKMPLFAQVLIIFVATHFVYAFNLLAKSLQICLNKDYYESAVD